MSFTQIFKTPIQNLSQVAKKLDDNISVFCQQLAKRLEVDEATLKIEFTACLQYFELQETPLKAKKLSEEEKEEKTRLKELEKAEKEAKKAQEKAEKEAKKAQEKAEKEAKKAQEKAEKEAEKEAKKAEKEAVKQNKKSETKKSSKSTSPKSMKIEEGFDFISEEPVEFEEDSEWWKGKTMKVGGVQCMFHEQTKLFIRQIEGKPVLYALKTGAKAIQEQDIDDDIKQWVQSCGIQVPSLE